MATAYIHFPGFTYSHQHIPAATNGLSSLCVTWWYATQLVLLSDQFGFLPPPDPTTSRIKPYRVFVGSRNEEKQ